MLRAATLRKSAIFGDFEAILTPRQETSRPTKVRKGSKGTPVKAKVVVAILLACAVASQAEILYQRILSMGYLGSFGRNPQTRLLLGPDGRLYGTTYGGGTSDRGTIFAIKPDGTGFQLLYQFKLSAGDGRQPYADLIYRSDGFFYGTTEINVPGNGGTIFKIRPDGTGYQVLFRFSPATGDLPRGHLLEGTDGFFYSTTQTGGPGTRGTVYKVRPDGTGFMVLHAFGTTPGDGSDCDTGLTLGSDGKLYGVSSGGGEPTGAGAVFKLNQDGTGFTVLHEFMGTDGYEPDGRPLELADGSLYGSTELSNGGGGVIYKINKDGSGFQILRIMPDGVPGSLNSELVPGSDGALYTTGFSALFKLRSDGTDVQFLHQFVRGPEDGVFARGVIFGPDAALYGVAQLGGVNDAGIVYRIRPDGSEYSVLHHFRHMSVTAATPRASLIKTDSGLFFGTAQAGGSNNVGAIFCLRPNGSESRVLFSFGVGANAARVPNRLCAAADGFLYGTTVQGGLSNAGVIYRISQNGSNYHVLRHLGATDEPRTAQAGLIVDAGGWLYGTSFSGGVAGRGTVYKVHKDTEEFVVLRSLTTADGYQPQSELVEASGNLYGTTGLGGAQNLGVVFRIEPSGSNYTVLHSFTGGAQGQNPTSGLMVGSGGKLYGTTARQLGGFAGSVYAINPDGSGFRTLRSFTNAALQPRVARSQLVEGSDGLLYGVTQSGGATERGTIFRIGKDGDRFAILYEFGVSAGDGQTPSAGLTSVGDGSFLGVTEAGGDNGNGAVFRFDPVEVRVRIGLTDTAAELRWPASSTVDELEATAALGAFDWHGVGATVLRLGDENEATVPRQSQGQLYRVRRGWE
jgi:uncharacterized repeat protein (TIGR03803 family)